MVASSLCGSLQMWSTLYAAAAAAAAARDHFVENVLVFTTPSSDNDCSTLPSTSHQISATNVDASEFSSSSSGCSQSGFRFINKLSVKIDYQMTLIVYHPMWNNSGAICAKRTFDDWIY